VEKKPYDFERMPQIDLATVLGVTTRTIQNWGDPNNLPRKAGSIPRNKDGTYHAPAVINWVIGHNILSRVERSR